MDDNEEELVEEPTYHRCIACGTICGCNDGCEQDWLCVHCPPERADWLEHADREYDERRGN